ncbi:FecR domain-containing protein [Chitinophaga oryzae]|uniref:FecR domain-containing protein n=1 Tax=Chitinophaga oryzae TaxID=2725414 RepID=A0AAE7D9B3_9BACT|nr:FecR domain-containing protein [Chitinophaga oryzae]QJB33048.1 FecR domain-containing protein [Chitinophaga oryzae]QJB39522.1 FecR domain-containing protein [Chitinophaga oryzae]
MNNEEAGLFVKRYAAGTATPEEHAAFEQWIHEQPLQEVQSLLDEYTLLMEQHPVWLPANRELLDRMLRELDRQQPARIVSLPWWKRKRSLAAGVALLLAAGSYALWQYTASRQHTTTVAGIVAGSTRATLQLADGTTIALDSTGTAGAAKPSHVVKIAAGLLQYNPRGETSATVYNTLTTPRGGQYQLLLQDGTRVWLNAASSIRFPVAFNGNERTVEVSGEAYFEVARQAGKPFIVKTGPMQVNVLGTRFIVSAYPEETQIRTTLAEGKVAVTTGGNTLQLAPGQQSVLPKGSDAFTLRNADTDQELGWKDGRFIFNGNIRDIMPQLERWYDIQVEYEGNISNQAFIGDISRNENLSEVLKILELTGKIHFRAVGRKIIVSP